MRALSLRLLDGSRQGRTVNCGDGEER